MNIALLFFLSIYSQGGTLASWAAQYTTMCLENANFVQQASCSNFVTSTSSMVRKELDLKPLNYDTKIK